MKVTALVGMWKTLATGNFPGAVHVDHLVQRKGHHSGDGFPEEIPKTSWTDLLAQKKEVHLEQIFKTATWQRT
uniref:Uncharacterized protein n=1 Tax=Anguilla anguilla TaxID=7936 RepID=A0A0E9WUD1_ANGAN